MNDMTEDEVRESTQEHIDRVKETMAHFCGLSMDRVASHDSTKLMSPEFEEFVKRTAALKGLTYGSEGYNEQLRLMEPALKHHYRCNRHHPEHFENGIDGMSLIDLVEMFCDWMAAVERHKDGDIFKSIEYNTKRFKLSPQMASVLKNTAIEVFGRKPQSREN